ncbi:component of the polarisome [Podochytrium sp. JEL0797]|nr:component of the polarisome [Podochytrium sp. JEL0797]
MADTADQFLTLRSFLGTEFLGSLDASEANSEASQQRMGRLNQQQFTVFTIDLIDEIRRRKEGDSGPPHLPARQDFHPKRNQTRQKLASLAILNFKKMACDVYFELERRFPNLILEHPHTTTSTKSQPPYSSARDKDLPTPSHSPQHLPKPPHTTSAPKPAPLIPPRQINVSNIPASANGKSIDEVMQELGSLVSPTRSNGSAAAASALGGSVGGGDAASGVLRDAMDRLRKDNALKLETLNSRIAVLETELSDTNRALDQSRREADENGEDYMNARKEVEGLQEELAESRQEAQMARKELNGVRKELSEAEKEVAAVRAEMSLLRQEGLDQLHTISENKKELTDAKKLYLDSQSESSALRAENEKQRQEIASLKATNQRQLSDYVALKTDYADIKSHVGDQQVLFGEVRTETTSLLAEVKSLAAKNQTLRTQNETLHNKNEEGLKMADDLAQQYEELVRSFDALKTDNDELREQIQQMSKRSGSGAKSNHHHNRPSMATASTPAPPPIHISSTATTVLSSSTTQYYQTTLTTLLTAIRTDSPAILPALKNTIAACKQVTEDVEEYEATGYTGEKAFLREDELDQARRGFSAAISALIAATKAVIAGSVGAVEGVDAAVVGLTGWVEKVAGLVKEKCGEEGGDEEEEAFERVQGLKEFVEAQTATIVEGIQGLLSTMRGPGNGANFLRDMNGKVQSICAIVKTILKASQAVFSRMGDEDEFKIEAEQVLNGMANARKRLEAKAGELVKDPGSGEIKQAIGASAYEVAKLVKKYVALLDEV